MALEVAPAQEGDIDRLMEVQFSAFENDPYHESLYPGDHFSPTVRRSAGERTIKEWRQDPSICFLKCMDRRTGRILGFAKWNLYDTERTEDEWRKRPTVDWCTGRQKEVAENFLGANAAMREKTWGGRPHLLLNLLCVHQDDQRKGAGTMLVRWGLERSQSIGLPAYLEASLVGVHLYRKLGFHHIDEMVVKAEEWDGDYDRRYAVMLKSPRTLEASVLDVKGGGNSVPCAE